jgi:hypothetical protein
MTALVSCEKKDNSTELIINGNVESGLGAPNAWWPWAENENFNLVWTEEYSYSPKKSLMISRQTKSDTDFTYWTQVIYNNIPIGKTVTLNVKIKGNLTGDGISIAIRSDSDTEMLQFVSSENNSRINGTFDWSEYSIQLPKIDVSTESLLVFLVYLPNTTGEVYFDDISLSY